MKAFITGGTGFIGKSVVRHLLQHEYEMYVLTRSSRNYTNQSSLTNIDGSLNDLDRLSEILKEIQPEVLIHLAWEDLPDYSFHTSRKNLDYGINLFSIAARSGCSTIVATGSCWEYLDNNSKVSEGSTLSSLNSFAAAKNSLRLMGKAISSEHGCKFYWLRLFYVYGPFQKRTSLIPSVINSIHKGHIPLIHNPYNSNDFIYVDDVARAIKSLIDKQPEKATYNIGSGNLTSIEEIINVIYQLSGKEIDPQIAKMFENNKLLDSEGFYADISRINSETGWKPEFSIIKGIRTYYDHFTNAYEN